MSATLIIFVAILKCLFHLYLWFLYFKMSTFIKESLLVKDPKSTELRWVGALEGRIPLSRLFTLTLSPPKDATGVHLSFCPIAP